MNMDKESFEKNTVPMARKSRLDPFRDQIFDLKEKQYANWQIADWLGSNGIKVSAENVRKFIKSREAKRNENLSIDKKDAPAVQTETPVTLPNDEKNEGNEPKQLTNMFRSKLVTNALGEVRRSEFEYNPTPDRALIYGETKKDE